MVRNHAQLIKLEDRTVQLAVVNDKQSYVIKTGVQNSALILNTVGPMKKEVSVSAARNAVAYMTTSITVDDGIVEKRVTTKYAGNATREDILRAAGKEITRKTSWKYGNGTTINATYMPGKRVLEILGKDLQQIVLETTAELAGNMLQTVTKHVSGPTDTTAVIGGVNLGPGSTVGSWEPNGQNNSHKVNNPDGSITTTTVTGRSSTPEQPESVTTTTTTTPPPAPYP